MVCVCKAIPLFLLFILCCVIITNNSKSYVSCHGGGAPPMTIWAKHILNVAPWSPKYHSSNRILAPSGCQHCLLPRTHFQHTSFKHSLTSVVQISCVHICLKLACTVTFWWLKVKKNLSFYWCKLKRKFFIYICIGRLPVLHTTKPWRQLMQSLDQE